MKAIIITDWVSVAAGFLFAIFGLFLLLQATNYYRDAYELVVDNCGVSPPIMAYGVGMIPINPLDLEVEQNATDATSEDRERIP